MVFPQTDLGVRYGAGAPDREGAGEGELYVPSLDLGSRLPHFWVTTADGQRLSTLDLVPTAPRPELLLMAAGPGADAWVDAARALRRGGNADPGAAVRIVAVCAPGQRPPGPADGVAVVEAASPQWAALWGRDGGVGAVLVRPDGHIAWRGPAAAPEDGAQLLQQAIARVMRCGLCD